ncbi:MAG: hypothetical protein R6X20_02275 [Phycisphaerae bacterium]
MPRCTKKDGPDGTGCVKEARHKGRCTVRPEAAKAWRRGEVPARKGRRRTGSPRGRSMVGLVRKIDAEIRKLQADVAALLAAKDRFERGAKARQSAILKSLVDSRKQVAAMKDALEGQAVRWDADFPDAGGEEGEA